MPSNTVTQFADELKMPAEVLLDQLRAAGVELKSVNDEVTDADKGRLLESLRRAHGTNEGQKITLTRRQTSEIRQADGSGRSRTIQVERRKKRVFVKRDPAELLAEAARAEAEGAQVAQQKPEPEAKPVEPVVAAPTPAPTPAPEAEAPPAVEPVVKPTEPVAEAKPQVQPEPPAQPEPEPVRKNGGRAQAAAHFRGTAD